MDQQKKFDLVLETMKLVLYRSDRFCEGTLDITKKQLLDIIKKHFGKGVELEKTGLKYAYNELVQDLYRCDPIIFGIITNGIEDTVINTYINQNNKTITLTSQNIINELFRYLNQDIVIDLCKKSKNYKMYYKYCIKHCKKNLY